MNELVEASASCLELQLKLFHIISLLTPDTSKPIIMPAKAKSLVQFLKKFPASASKNQTTNEVLRTSGKTVHVIATVPFFSGLVNFNPLVMTNIAMENHHFKWEKSL